MDCYDLDTREYNQNLFLNLYNGLESFEYCTKKDQITLERPRLSVFAAQRHFKIANKLHTETSEPDCNDLMALFLISTPALVMSSELKSNSSNSTNELNLDKLFIAHKILFNKKLTFTFDNDGFKLIEDMFKEYSDVAMTTYNNNPFKM